MTGYYKAGLVAGAFMAVAVVGTSLPASAASIEGGNLQHTDTVSVVYDAMRRPLYQAQGNLANPTANIISSSR
jgi:hypothetical protein